MEEIKNFLKDRKIKEALEKFKALSEAKQEDFFRELVPTLFPPPYIGVLYRKLRPGFTFDDFYKSWLPPLKEGQDLEHYFPTPTYVMNAENENDPTDIISIGFMWISAENYKELEKKVGETEKVRHDHIEKVAHKTQPTEVYILKSVTKLGS